MTPEDEAFEELDRKLNTKRIAKAMTNLNKELEIFRNEVIEEIGKDAADAFKAPVQDTAMVNGVSADVIKAAVEAAVKAALEAQAQS